jgi:hypothetical protein
VSEVVPVAIAVSDSTGETAEQVCRAALAQFGQNLVGRVRIVPHVRDEVAVRAAVRTAKDAGAVLAYTLVDPEIRGLMKQVSLEQGVTAVDLLSELVSKLARHLHRDPLSLPGLGHALDAAYFRRIDAVEFSMNHDDGQRPTGLPSADLVILGVSRSSKTPLASFIAHKGLRVANVPIVREIPLPKELEQVDPRRVFGLVIDPSVLATIRQSRMASWGMDAGDSYGDLDTIRAEIAHARRVYAAHPAWTVIDMTQRAIEETAALILEEYQRRFGGALPSPPVPPRTARTTAARSPRRARGGRKS